MKQSGIKRKYGDWAWGYFFVLPTVIGLIVLNIYPIFQTLIMSFSESAAFGQYEISGVQNYVKMMSDKDVWFGLRNTLIFTLVSVPLGIIISIFLASLMSRKIKGVGVYRVLYFMPMIAAPAAVAMVWRLMYNNNYGVINQIIRMFGGKGVSWLSDPKIAMLSVIIVTVWSGLGQQIVILIGAITNVSKSYYEAAEIDGASPMRQLISITMPLVSPSIFFLLITGMIGALKQFDIVYMLYGERGNTAMDSVRTLMHTYYIQAFKVNDKAYASAIVILAFVVIMIFTVIQFIGERKWVHYDD